MEIYSRTNLELLLHKIIFNSEVSAEKNTRKDFSAASEFLQISRLNFNKGKTFQAHIHNFRSRYFSNYNAQECWIIIKGVVKVSYFDIDGILLYECDLGQGDLSITFRGGHQYEIKEDDSLIYEFKTGPYEGVEVDKTKINFRSDFDSI